MMEPYDLDEILTELNEKHPHQNQFRQAVHDVFNDVVPFVNEHEKYQGKALLEQLLIPDRVIEFKVTWLDGDDQLQVNRGWRVQHNNVLGAYKGGLRFHPAVNTDTFKFLAFEQTFKNALTGLPMGGGKGGADFNPKGKSDADIMRFCHAFMVKLNQYIGPAQDVPAGDIGVGSKEIGFLFGAYKQLSGQFNGVLTGKPTESGGSYIRKEATGYGCVFFLEAMLGEHEDDISDQVCAVSGAGNVAIYTVEMLLEKQATVITMSDSGGTLYAKNGLTTEQLNDIKEVKEKQGGSLQEVANHFSGLSFEKDVKPWRYGCDVAIPCATQNEIDEEDAKQLIKNKIRYLAEAANMPLTEQATKLIVEHGVVLGPSKAVNAGGVAVSGLERTQNALLQTWPQQKVCEMLQHIMCDIHQQCVSFGKEPSQQVNYIKGANLAAFVKLSEGMLFQGIS